MQITRHDAAPAAAHAFDILAIVFVALLIATSFVGFSYWSKARTAEMKYQRATETVAERVSFRSGDENVDTLHEHELELASQARDLTRVLGFYEGEDATSNVEAVVALLDEMNEEFQLCKQRPTVARAIAALEQRIAALVNDEDGIKKLEARRDFLQGEYEKTLGIVGKKRAELAAELTRLDEEISRLDASRKSLRAGGASSKRELMARRDAALQAVRRARRQKQRVQKSLFEVRKFYKDEVDRMKAKWINVKFGLEELVDRIQIVIGNPRDKSRTRPDGQLLSSNTSMQVGWIDLTRKDRIVRGMKFQVFRFLKGGKEQIRGEVQVIRVGERMSKVRITQRRYKGKVWKMAAIGAAPALVAREFQIDPLQRGDMIRNLRFDRREKRIFVFAGELTGPPDARVRYKAAEAKKLLEALGDEVAVRVDDRTSYLVLGKGYKNDPGYKAAKELGVPVISERELMEILGKY